MENGKSFFKKLTGTLYNAVKKKHKNNKKQRENLQGVGELLLGSKERLKFNYMSSAQFDKLSERLKDKYMSSARIHKGLRLK